MKFNDFETDKSWGMVGFYRASGSEKELFGSDVTNVNTIRLCLKEGQYNRCLGHTHYMGGNLIAEIELSSNQFSDLLTNMNVGDGVPCTIKWLRDIGEVPYKSQKPKIDIIKEEKNKIVEEAIESLNKGIKQLSSLIADGKLSKKSGNELLDIFNKSYSNLAGDSKKFFEEQANKELKNMVTEAKRQVQTYIDNKIYSTGLKSIQEGFNSPTLIENNSNKNY